MQDSLVKYVPKGSCDSIGSADGLAPNRRQAIIWTNDGPIYWSIYASFVYNSTSRVGMMVAEGVAFWAPDNLNPHYPTTA